MTCNVGANYCCDYMYLLLLELFLILSSRAPQVLQIPIPLLCLACAGGSRGRFQGLCG
jgi:hypothetical protein